MATDEVVGLKELSEKLSKLGKIVGGKFLRGSAMSATLPALKKAKALIPKGTEPHKTYKGRLVGGGFASRNIIRKSYINKDKTTATVWLGVKQEAFYAVSFIELGWQPGKRSKSWKQKARRSAGSTLGNDTSRKDKIPADPWLEPAFNKTQKQMVERLKNTLRKKIEKEAKK